jgi:hypothetical protein
MDEALMDAWLWLYFPVLKVGRFYLIFFLFDQLVALIIIRDM